LHNTSGKKAKKRAVKQNALLTRQLRRKFGLQPPLESLLLRLPGLPLERLEDLADALLDFGQVDELQDWLDRAP
jgi:hypothetical protein